MELHLPLDIEHALIEQARRLGTTPEQLALEGLRRQFVHPGPTADPATAPGTLAEFPADFIGVLHSGEYEPGGARLSERTGESFTRIVVEKRQQGHL
jgi:hypothetical protein